MRRTRQKKKKKKKKRTDIHTLEKNRPAERRAFSYLLAAALLLPGIAGCGGENQTSELGDSGPRIIQTAPRSGGIEIGNRLPRFEAVTLAGGRWSGDLGGNVTLVNIWATWCTPCRYEIPDLIELKSAWGPKGFEVLGVSVDNPGTAPQIQQFVRDFEINYTVVHDPGMTTLDAFDTTVVPTTVLVDRDGNVRWHHIGPVSSDDPELIDLLTELLGSLSPSPTVSL